MDLEALADRWRGLFSVDARLAFADLVAHYTEPSRRYHTLDHITSVLDVVAWLDPGAAPALALAAWLHDVIYDSRAGDNEERSAEYARRVLSLLDVPAAVQDETARLILLTKSHTTDANDSAGQVLLDADLAILGAAAGVYDGYAGAIRQEYHWVPEADYRAGRRRILERFLSRPRIYFTSQMFAQHENQARENLAREIAALDRC